MAESRGDEGLVKGRVLRKGQLSTENKGRLCCSVI